MPQFLIGLALFGALVWVLGDGGASGPPTAAEINAAIGRWVDLLEPTNGQFAARDSDAARSVLAGVDELIKRGLSATDLPMAQAARSHLASGDVRGAVDYLGAWGAATAGK